MPTGYLHFAYKVLGNNNIILSAALFADEKAKELVDVQVRKYKRWGDNAYLDTLQAFEHALFSLRVWQKELKKYDVHTIYLVFNNKRVAEWIEDGVDKEPYASVIKKIIYRYRTGGDKEILQNLIIYWGEVKNKANKYCKEEYIVNKNNVQLNKEDLKPIIEDDGIKISNFKRVEEMH